MSILSASDSEKVLVSLTGGFDGRCNLALLDHPKENFLCYSMDARSRQIKVPEKIAYKTGINYKPIILDENFVRNYAHIFLILATYFSNGSAPISFANIYYAFNQLSSYSDVAVTGSFGSEILRPLRIEGTRLTTSPVIYSWSLEF